MLYTEPLKQRLLELSPPVNYPWPLFVVIAANNNYFKIHSFSESSNWLSGIP